jgi:hypothetical protein
MAFNEFKQRFLYPRFNEKFSGRVGSGRHFRRPLGRRFEFILEPTPYGWEIRIKEYGRDENLARLTPSFHFAPHPGEIEGWHLLENPTDCTKRPYNADAGPENPRKLIFSPEVGRSLQYSGSATSNEVVKEVGRFGRCVMNIEKFKLTPEKNGCPRIEWMSFSVQLEGGY